MEFPSHKWLPWHFVRVRSSYWTDSAKRREFFDWAAAQLPIVRMEDWYNVTSTNFRNLGGAGLLATMYGDSVAQAIMDAFPNHSWQFWRFKKVPIGIWSQIERQKEFMEYVKTTLSISNPEDWYAITTTQLEDLGALTLIRNIYNMQLPDLIKATTFPGHRWQRWKFTRLGRNLWADEKTVREYVMWLHDELGLQSLDDWYSVSKLQVKQLHGAPLLRRHNESLLKILAIAYPDHKWDQRTGSTT